jgi:CBS domain containing-hemolysin-like protein
LLSFEPDGADDVETLGGLMSYLLDRIPQEGDVARIAHAGAEADVHVTFEVLEMDRFRVEKVSITITTTPHPHTA